MLNNYVIIHKENTAYRVIDGEAIVVNLKTSTFCTLNSVATFIWEHLDGKTTLKSIAERLPQEFEVNYETAAKDCVEFISDLLDRDMVILSSCPRE